MCRSNGQSELLQAKVLRGDAFGVYLHVPFCASVCDFCAFYQEKPRRGDLERYLCGVERELALLPEPPQAATMFWGGGTPGLLPAGDLLRLGQAMVAKFGQPVEWTVEMAPSTVKADKIDVLSQLGVTRISMGVQSFQPQLLQSLGRLHAPDQVYRAYDCLRSVGCANVNLDLIFAIPNQSLEQWQQDLHEAVQLRADHISTYCLTFEEDTALYVKLSQGEVSIDAIREEAFFRKTWQELATAGFSQYEVANFARPGGECWHNINTWAMGQWIGIGPAAYSQWQRRRYRNPASLSRWLEGLRLGVPAYEDITVPSVNQWFADCLIFGLRMNRGVDLADIHSRYPSVELATVDAYIESLCTENYAQRSASKVVLTAAGLLVADRIGAEMLALLA